MNKIDFLSGSPDIFIFGQKSNKTQLGGYLTMIYFIIVLIISIAYMYDYYANNKYSVLYIHQRDILTDEERKKIVEDENLNPEITFKIKLTNSNEKSFYLCQSKGNNYFDYFNISEECEYKSKVYDFYFMIMYKCSEDFNCTLREEDKKSVNLYEFAFNYSGFKLERQNEESPLQKTYVTDFLSFSINDKLTFYEMKWKSIKYTEEKGLFGTFEKNILGKSNEYYGGEFLYNQVLSVDKVNAYRNLEKALNARLLNIFRVNPLEEQFDNYIRTKKGIFDPISLICSLSLTIYNGLILVVRSFYSKYFDNYKIIENFFFNNKKDLNKNKIKYNSDKAIELSSDFYNKENLLETNTNDNEDILTMKGKDNEYNTNNEKKERIFPKLSFYDFIFNNIYCKKCCTSKKQDLLEICNKIISKYYTMDYIIYNQMRLENLFKDYKWNDPGLNIIENNEMINELKLILNI